MTPVLARLDPALYAPIIFNGMVCTQNLSASCSLRRPRRRMSQLTAAGDGGLRLDSDYPQVVAEHMKEGARILMFK